MQKLNIVDIRQNDLSEINQTSCTKFALLEKDGDTYTNVTPLVGCRDYFNDVMFVQHNDEHELGEVYGFRWEYSTAMAGRFARGECEYMLLTYDEGYGDDVISSIHRILGNDVILEEVIAVVNAVHSYSYTKYMIIKVPSRYMSGSIMLSLFTFIIRCQWYNEHTCAAHLPDILSTIKSRDATDSYIAQNMYVRIEAIHHLLNGNNSTIGYGVFDLDIEEGDITELVHDGSGINSFLSGINATSSSSVEPAVLPAVTRFRELF